MFRYTPRFRFTFHMLALVFTGVSAFLASRPATAQVPELFVGNIYSNTVKRYNSTTGAFDNFASGGGLSAPQGLTFGLDGNLYVSSQGTNQVLRYNGTTGASMGVFASGLGLSGPAGLTFGRDGNLYVNNQDFVSRFNGSTGAFIDIFASGTGSGNGMVFGPDGNLYLTRGGANAGSIIRFNGTTGAFIDVFASGGNLDFPLGLTFGPDNNLYVTQNKNPGASNIIRYNGATGAYIDNFTSGGNLIAPFDLKFGPDGILYVSSDGTDDVQRFNGTTGAFIDVFASGGGAQDSIHYLTFRPVRALVSGIVTLGDCNAPEQNITFEFRPKNGGTPFKVKQVLTQSGPNSGTFSLPNIPAGTYDIAIKGYCWLQQVIPNVVVSSNVSGLSAALINADLNNDNSVDIADFGILVNDYGAVGDP